MSKFCPCFFRMARRWCWGLVRRGFSAAVRGADGAQFEGGVARGPLGAGPADRALPVRHGQLPRRVVVVAAAPLRLVHRRRHGTGRAAGPPRLVRAPSPDSWLVVLVARCSKRFSVHSPADRYMYAVLTALPWVGRELYEKKENELERIMAAVEAYLRRRNTAHVAALRVWNCDAPHPQEEYLDCLWAQVRAERRKTNQTSILGNPPYAGHRYRHQHSITIDLQSVEGFRSFMVLLPSSFKSSISNDTFLAKVSLIVNIATMFWFLRA